VVGTNNHADIKIYNYLIGRLLSYNSWAITLITTGISCTGCIHIYSPKCTLHAATVVPERKTATMKDTAASMAPQQALPEK